MLKRYFGLVHRPLQLTHMKNELSLRNMKPVAAALPACTVPPFLQLAHARSRRPIRIVPPAAPRRPLCPTERTARAAAVAAELAVWFATGGDFLSSANQSAR